MNRILAIAALTLRSAVRSRLAVLLLVLLLASVFGLPLAVRGDGTAEGLVQVIIAYSLGFAGVLSALAAVWTGCAAISSEIAGRQIHLMVTKPVHPAELWLGKWLGLLALNLAMVWTSGAAVYGLLRWQTRPERIGDTEYRRLKEEFFVSRTVLPPLEPDITEEVNARIRETIQSGDVPDSDVEQLRIELRRQALAAQRLIPAGGRRDFVFRLPRTLESDRRMHLSVRLLKSALDFESIQGRWIVGTPDTPRIAAMEVSIPPISKQSFTLPELPMTPGEEIRIGFENLDPAGNAVLFDPEGGLELLVWRGGLEGNMARALWVWFGQLAFVSAVGLSAGALFSMPVASFAALTLVALIRMGGFISRVSEEGAIFFSLDQATPTQALLERSLRGFFHVLQGLLGPLQTPDFLADLSTGRRISPHTLWGAVGVQGLLYSGALALLMLPLFRRRELGLPQEGL
ncbi:MAG: hypothetical protein KBA51_04575 [Kiritimatiellae bacterium]|nr:hypothetical protein [Kiritimatiellia bacterium]